MKAIEKSKKEKNKINLLLQKERERSEKVRQELYNKCAFLEAQASKTNEILAVYAEQLLFYKQELEFKKVEISELEEENSKLIKQVKALTNTLSVYKAKSKAGARKRKVN